MEKNSKFQKIINGFQNKRIAVIGDIMLDRFLMGSSNRISVEAPVPIVRLKEELTVAGGAANVAANIQALGGQTFLLGVVGCDSQAEELMSVLHKLGIDVDGVIKDKSRLTTEKIRLISDGKQVTRMDRETIAPLDAIAHHKIINFLKNNVKTLDGVVFSDYAKGVITSGISKTVIPLFKKYGEPIVVDAKPQNFHFFRGATIMAPNIKEATEVSGTQDIIKAGQFIQKKFNCQVLITRGHDGMTLLKGNKINHIDPIPREVFDIVGAGDTATAALALALASRASSLDAALLANLAASIAVSKPGTATVSAGELKSSIYLI